MGEHIALRVRDHEGGSRLYPASKFDYLSHSLRHTVYAVFGGHVFPLADCVSKEECLAVESEIYKVICGPPDAPCPQIRDLNAVAYAALGELRKLIQSEGAISVWDRTERKTDSIPLSLLVGATVVEAEDDGAEGVAWVTLRLVDERELVLNPAGENDTLSAHWREASP